MAFHRESYGGKRVLPFYRVRANEYTPCQQASPFGDKRRTARKDLRLYLRQRRQPHLTQDLCLYDGHVGSGAGDSKLHLKRQKSKQT